MATALGIDQPRASKLVAAAVAAGPVRREADQAMADWPAGARAEFARLLTRFLASLGAVTR